jgi:hypothetical protein
MRCVGVSLWRVPLARHRSRAPLRIRLIGLRPATGIISIARLRRIATLLIGRETLCRRIPAWVSLIARAAIAIVLIHVSIHIARRAIARAAASIIASVPLRISSIAHHKEEYTSCHEQSQ